MTSAVTWALAAVQELSRIESASDDPAGARKAGEWVDYTLRRIPLNVGESRFGPYRLWYGDVLGVYSSVDQDAGTVRVLAVGPARRR